MPILTYDAKMLEDLDIKDQDTIRADFVKGEVINLKNNKIYKIPPFSEVQLDIYKNGGLF